MPSNSELAAEHRVTIGDVPIFAHLPSPREEIRKLVEESAEVFGAFERMDTAKRRVVAYADPSLPVDGLRDASDTLIAAETDLRDEIADVVQVVGNLCAGVGIEDLRPDIRRCRRRNEERGREYAN